jgi:hypothetical protein
MKEFKKSKDNLFICEECGKLCKTLHGFGHHISCNHDLKKYFDTWLKEENDNICVICGNKTQLHVKILYGYRNTCCKKCENENRRNSVISANNQNKDKILQKRKDTCIKKYDVDNPFKSETIKKKIKKTTEEIHGNENYRNIEKSKQTCIERYGVENPTQWNNSYNAGLRIHTKTYKNTKLFYQGSYELDFLNKYYDIYPDMQRAPSIKYVLNGKDRVYFPDFYIPSLNLIVEIKNSYLAKRYKENITAKEKATIANGFNYIIIVDKNYSKINFLVSNRPFHQF